MTLPRTCESDSYYNLFIYDCTNSNSTCQFFSNSTFTEINHNIKACSCPSNQYLETNSSADISCLTNNDTNNYISLDGINLLTCNQENMDINCNCLEDHIRMHNSSQVLCQNYSEYNEQPVKSKSKCENGYLDDTESTCYCLSDSVLAIDGCVKKNDTISNAVESTEDIYLKYFYKAYAGCKTLNNNSTQSCQILGHLCTLKMFDMTNDICSIFDNSSLNYNSDLYSR